MRKRERALKKTIKRAERKIMLRFIRKEYRKGFSYIFRKLTLFDTQKYGQHQNKRRWRSIQRAKLKAEKEGIRKEVWGAWLEI